MSRDVLKKIASKIKSGNLDSKLILHYNEVLESMITDGFKDWLRDDELINVMYMTEKYDDLMQIMIQEECEKKPEIFNAIDECVDIALVKFISRIKYDIKFKILKHYRKSKEYSEVIIDRHNFSYSWLYGSKQGILFFSNTSFWSASYYCPIVKINDTDFVVCYLDLRFWPHEFNVTNHFYNSKIGKMVKLDDCESFLYKSTNKLSD